MKEIWKQIKGYEGHYEVSNFGNVKSIKRIVNGNKRQKIKTIPEKLLAKRKIGEYLAVILAKERHNKSFLVHRLVAINFIPNPENKKEVNHLDSNPSNNHVSNLNWATISENRDHTVQQNRHAKGDKCGRSKLKSYQVVKIRNSLKDIKELAKVYGVTKNTISNILLNKSWKSLL